MILNRTREITIGITLSIVISLLGFISADIDLSEPAITGQVIFEDNPIETGYKVSGIYFETEVNDDRYYLYFSDDGWYQSNNEIDFEKRIDMGNSIWSGLYYLRGYDATVFYKNKEITDITEFAREFK